MRMISIRDDSMTDQSRVWKVLLVLLASMTVGTVLLMALGNNAPVSGAFSLSSYYKLASPSQAIALRTSQQPNRWERIEISYSETRFGNIQTMATLRGLADPAELNMHFVICNGNGSNSTEGQIQATERWQTQRSIEPLRNWGRPQRTIGICIIGDNQSSPPTDCQIRRASALVEALRHRFQIDPSDIHWPGELNLP